MREAADLHQPVLLQDCVRLLAPALQAPGSVMVDGTLGMGGHTEAVLQRCPEAIVVGIDRDPQALQLASTRLAGFGDRFIPFAGTYDEIPQVADAYGKGGLVDAVLLDLGVSSLQLDDVGRGFAYAQDGPLDMRMDQSAGQSAAQLLNTAPAGELVRILREYGEEKAAKQIVRAVVDQRANSPIATTGELVALIDRAMPAPLRRRGGNPAKRTFQALRIAVNDELEILRQTIPRALSSLRVGGRLVVESYQSLEDRLVKRTFAAGLRDTAPPGLPIIPESDLPRLRALTHGAEKADAAEIAANPRAKSVRLRAVEIMRPWRSE